MIFKNINYKYSYSHINNTYVFRNKNYNLKLQHIENIYFFELEYLFNWLSVYVEKLK